jgi:hypothetical protein
MSMSSSAHSADDRSEQGVRARHGAVDRDDVAGPSSGDRAGPWKVRRILIALGATVGVALVIAGVRVDHHAAIDLQGFVRMTEPLGGVDVPVAPTTTTGPYTYRAGLNTLDGEAALHDLHQRHELPGGDIDRAKRQRSSCAPCAQSSPSRTSWAVAPGLTVPCAV